MNPKATEHILLSADPASRNLLDRALLIARQSGPIMIEGETGTGKTLLAQWLHSYSKRDRQALVTCGCGEIDNEVIESTLFGHKRGAYTGAIESQTGLLEQAHNGTLVLNDIHLLPLQYQARLLRFLDDGCFFVLGDPGRPVQSDVRIMVTTNKDLAALARKKQFLPDLLYRLQRWRLKTKPLHQRPQDICLLAAHYLQQFQRAAEINAPKKPEWRFSAKTLDLFSSLIWPGNIRQLREAVENIALFCEGNKCEIGPQQASSILFHPEYPIGCHLPDTQSKQQLQKILNLSEGNLSLAARIAGISRTTYYKKIKDPAQRG